MISSNGKPLQFFYKTKYFGRGMEEGQIIEYKVKIK